MPKAPVVNQQLAYKKLLTHLSQSGPLKAKNLCEVLSISQPAFSRLIAYGQGPIIRIGRGPQTLYACHRLGSWGDPKIPICLIDEQGTLSRIATLHPISPKGFYLESHTETLSTKIYEHLPYFFEDLRPSGFLGRLVPRLYPELGFPNDISIWTDDHCLVYLARCGWDLIGNFIIGEKSEQDYVTNLIERTDVVDDSLREEHYPHVAELVLSQGIPGSSAAGEHPKFLSIRKTKNGLLPVIVKFSPPVVDAVSQRVADLLVCEYIGHEVLRKYGKAAPQSCLIRGGGRLFLEVERFDRNRSGGRFGVVSLRALDLEFVGALKSWPDTAKSLFNKKIIDQAAYQEIVWLDLFGKLIGNSDRHHGNISFFCNGEEIAGLTPVYDMLPMIYAPQQNQLVNRTLIPTPPRSDEMPVWNDALSAARYFWDQVQHHSMISEDFKKLTASNESILRDF
ncbi:MAG: type II toxin-antitoxin system HipA family toxin YjjJ [Deltaproteobacteria bacterium]|nr:type II toxin-antitoxin system HipA family toxin YjjJ [Deltaproteobacteria bacterium]